MTENQPRTFHDIAPYDRSLVNVATIMPIVIMSPVFLLIAYSEPTLSGLALGLFFIVPAIILTTVYGLGVPGTVSVTAWGVVVKHGLLVRIRIPREAIVSTAIDSPPWWLNYYYLHANAQWLRVGKSVGFLNWWYIPTTNATRLKLAIESIQPKPDV
jgi:hypothetical protein